MIGSEYDGVCCVLCLGTVTQSAICCRGRCNGRGTTNNNFVVFSAQLFVKICTTVKTNYSTQLHN
jgi:hypothetical protein